MLLRVVDGFGFVSTCFWYFVIAEASNWYLLYINIFYLLRKMCLRWIISHFSWAFLEHLLPSRAFYFSIVGMLKSASSIFYLVLYNFILSTGVFDLSITYVGI
jgi:hypothetical protein